MKIILLTPGTGSYYCGVCMRDNALAKELIRQGHEAIILPMYLPLTLEESSASPDTPIFFGGINVYLQQKLAIFRREHAPILLYAGWVAFIFVLHPVSFSALGSSGSTPSWIRCCLSSMAFLSRNFSPSSTSHFNNRSHNCCFVP